MNLRYRLANWLTDGRYEKLRKLDDEYGRVECHIIMADREFDGDSDHPDWGARLVASVKRIEDQRDFAEARAYEATAHTYQLQHDINTLETGLREIIAMQTPGANATVRRMVAVAKRALDPLKSEASVVLAAKAFEGVPRYGETGGMVGGPLRVAP